MAGELNNSRFVIRNGQLVDLQNMGSIFGPNMVDATGSAINSLNAQMWQGNPLGTAIVDYNALNPNSPITLNSLAVNTPNTPVAVNTNNVPVEDSWSQSWGLTDQNGNLNLQGIGQGIAGLAQLGSTVGNLIMANRSYDMMKDQFKFQKNMAMNNYNNSLKQYNTRLADVANNRTQFSGNDHSQWYEDNKL